MTAPAGNRRWFRILLSGKPHQIIQDNDTLNSPYMLRWYLIPRNHHINVYLHKFLRDDIDEALHDHPWWFVSIILRGGYIEYGETEDGKLTVKCRTAITDWRSPWWHRSVAYRLATHRHRIALPHTRDGGREPCWTVIITGRNSRTWGFWCKPERFIPWYDFISGGGCAS